MVSFTPLLLYPPLVKIFQDTSDRRLGGPQSRSGRRGEDKKILDFTGIRTRGPLGRPARAAFKVLPKKEISRS
jgi:hypothetical protein